MSQQKLSFLPSFESVEVHETLPTIKLDFPAPKSTPTSTSTTATSTFVPTTFVPFETPKSDVVVPQQPKQNCALCAKQLSSFGVNMYNGKPYCSTCFDDVSAPACKACGQPLKDYWTEVDGNNYHEECFKCAKCSKVLSTRGHFCHQGIYYCRGCAWFQFNCNFLLLLLFISRWIWPSQQGHCKRHSLLLDRLTRGEMECCSNLLKNTSQTLIFTFTISRSR